MHVKDDAARLDPTGGLTARARELLGEDGGHWVRKCQKQVDFATRHWGLSSLEPLHGGRGGLVLRALTADGSQVVLKVPIIEKQHHLRAQIALAEAGVGPQVRQVDMNRGLLLLDHVEATPMTRPASRAEMHAAGHAVARLHAAAVDKSFPPLASWISRRLTAPPVDRARDSWSSSNDRDRAAGLLETLTGLKAGDTFLHGDLNVGNILYNARIPDSATLIDARGMIGDPAYDYAVLASKTLGRDCPREQIEETAACLAEDAGHCPERAAAWVDIALAALV